MLSYGQIHSKNNAKTGIVGGLLRFVPDSITDGCSESLAVKNGFIFADTSEDLDGYGNCNYIDQNGIYAGYHTVNLKPKTEEDWKYLGYLFQTDAWRYQLRKELTEVKLYSISQKALKSTTILVPPRDEREAIVAFLDSKCAAIDDAIERHKQIIEKSKCHCGSLRSTDCQYQKFSKNRKEVHRAGRTDPPSSCMNLWTRLLSMKPASPADTASSGLTYTTILLGRLIFPRNIVDKKK